MAPDKVVVTFSPEEAWATHWELNEAFGECEPPWSTTSPEEQEMFFALKGALRAVRVGLRDSCGAFGGRP